MPTYDGAAAVTGDSAVAAVGARVMFAAAGLLIISEAAVVGVVDRQASAAVVQESFAESIPERSHEHEIGVHVTIDAVALVAGERETYGAAVVAMESSAVASVCRAAYGLTVRDGIDSVLRLWGAACPSSGSCDSPVAEEAVNMLNAAFQKLHASGKFFGWVAERDLDEEAPIDPADGGTIIREFTLPRKVQNIAGPLILIWNDGDGNELERVTLRSLPSKNALGAMSKEYADSVWDEIPEETKPVAFWAHSYQSEYTTLIENVDRLKHEGVTIHLAPPIYRAGASLEGVYTFDVRVALKPPRFSCMDQDIRLPVPLEHAETLLLPLARYYAMSSRYFTRPELRQAIVEQAADVLKLLGDMEPSPKEAAQKSE